LKIKNFTYSFLPPKFRPRYGLKKIKISNFRAFSKSVDIRIRPITVLIGPNSSGKSTLIKFLLMLQQTLETGEDAFLVTEGRHVSLGRFEDLKNRSSDAQHLEFEMELETEALPQNRIDEIKKRLTQTGKPGSGSELPNERESSELSKKTFRVSASVPYEKGQAGRHDVSLEDIFVAESDDLRQAGFLSFPADPRNVADILDAFVRDLYLKNLRRELRSFRHISPIREEYQRRITLKSPPPDDVGHTGEFAMPHLQRLLEDKEKADFIRKYMRNVLDIEALRFIPNYMGHECRARNKLTGSDIYLADFGFGVSQCIPVFVQSTLLSRGQLLMLEQPEAQLHPTAQLEMGSFFADLWNTRGVPCLIETHSQNIILRLRKHVVGGDLNAEDVSIAYFHIEGNTVRVKNLDIRPDGSLDEGLPMRFFGADVLEALEMEAGI